MITAPSRFISNFCSWARTACCAVILISSAVLAPTAFAEPEELIWKDLLPPGEENVLNKLYDEFYLELEERFDRAYAEAEPLSEADPNATDPFAEGGALDVMPQIGTFNVVDDLDGLDVRLPGYIVPLSFKQNNKYDEFLLVPYFGACLHTPPPPPNQIVYVMANETIKIEDIWSPYWIEGTMHTKRHENETGDAAYTLSLSKLTLYDN